MLTKTATIIRIQGDDAVTQMQKNGGELLAETLKQAGVNCAFALHGGHMEALLKGCVEQEIELIDCRHEAAAGHAADAYARATTKLGVCIVTAGPGIANAMPAVTNSFLDATPTLFLIGAPPLREAETNPLQGGFDQIAMLTPVSKWAHRITHTERIPDIAAMAIRKALTGKPGPVVLELPIDMLHTPVAVASTTKAAGISVYPRPAPSLSELEQLKDALQNAQRPAIILGGHSRQSDCGAEITQFAERSGIPIFDMAKSSGLLPSRHRLRAGRASVLGALSKVGIPNPDLVLLLGGRLGLQLGGRSGMVIPDEAKLIQVYPDAGEIGRIRDVQLPIEADPKSTLEALLQRTEGDTWPDWSEWTDQVLKVQHMSDGLYPDAQLSEGIHPFHAAKKIADMAGPEAAYVADGGESSSWADDVIKTSGPGRFLGHGYLGCLGIGPGFSIGLQKAFPDRRVVQITGDGAMGFHIQEWDTMVRHRLPIMTVILNNQVWGMSIHGQQIMFGANYAAITRLADTQYADIARSFGCHAERVEHYQDLEAAIERCFAHDGPSCLEIMTDENAVHPITPIMLGEAEEGSNEILIPYYENITPGGA